MADKVFFYEREFYPLSNFSSFMLEWKGLLFPTSEHAYQWEKFPAAPEVQAQILAARSAHAAFKIARANGGLVRPEWHTIKDNVMLDILIAKARQHPYVLKKLLETGGKELVEDSPRDDYWGWGPNKNGSNRLGILWMVARGRLANGPVATFTS